MSVGSRSPFRSAMPSRSPSSASAVLCRVLVAIVVGSLPCASQAQAGSDPRVARMHEDMQADRARGFAPSSDEVPAALVDEVRLARSRGAAFDRLAKAAERRPGPRRPAPAPDRVICDS